MHKTHIFDQKNNEKNTRFTDLPTIFFSDRYRKQTISFFRPKITWESSMNSLHSLRRVVGSVLNNISFSFSKNTFGYSQNRHWWVNETFLLHIVLNSVIYNFSSNLRSVSWSDRGLSSLCYCGARQEKMTTSTRPRTLSRQSSWWTWEKLFFKSPDIFRASTQKTIKW